MSGSAPTPRQVSDMRAYRDQVGVGAMKSGDGDRLAHWRGQQKELAQMLDDLPINSIARSSLETALAMATQMVAYYEELGVTGDPETGPA